jgi:exodeoxyribonuclease V gamma subunit
MVGTMPASSRLQLHTSNRLEILADQLARVLARPLASALRPEIVVVQSVGVSRWLTHQLAQRVGIWANIEFPFAQKLVATLFDDALPDRAAGRFYAREVLTWRIMGLLPSLLQRAEFQDLRRYISDRPREELRLFQLSGKIAASFDGYLAYRPRLILGWERGADQHWQAILWREITRSAPGLHPPSLFREFSAALRKGTARLPERVSFFGISSLPQFYLEVLQELAQRIDVHLFLVQPTPDWWSDIRSKREEVRARRRVSTGAQLFLQFERGNPLLASMGKVGREFLELVAELTPAREHDLAEEPKGESKLAQIQREIFRLESVKHAAAPGDGSLQFHSCHSRMREMEVLHDQLLALFEAQPDLKPHDIVVMAPDIASYAPVIEAVFATSREEQRIPFSIADRGARAENGVIDTFLQVLESAGSRFTASSVMSILESVALQRRFCLSEADLETVRAWTAKTGIRWGIDAAHRAELGLPEFNENSWRFGLERLLLGYSAAAGGEQLFAGILAFDEVEGSLAETLGSFAEFCESLFATASTLKQPRTLAEWQEVLRLISARFFEADDETEAEMRQLRTVIDALSDLHFDEVVTLDVLLAHLEQALASIASSAGFRAGRVTFCALKPMRTIPFRIVCLVGMNDTAYPRHSSAPAFDLIAQNPQPGDRSTRSDDRYLFLEALLSARDVFYVSYIGQSIRDNSKIPPSVVVSELIEYAHSAVTEHRLQPFSSEYFRAGTALFSYSAENCSASAIASSARSIPPPFISKQLGEPEDEWRHLDAAQLVSFFGHPARFFIKERLQIRPAREDELLEDSEPTDLHSLAKYSLQQELLAQAVRGEAFEPILPIVRARGDLPPGHAGEAKLRAMCTAAAEFAGFIRQHVAPEAVPPRDITLSIGDFELSTRFDHLYRGRLVRYRLTSRKPKDLLRIWIEHLIMNCESATESLLISADKNGVPQRERFGSLEPETARQRLDELLKLYWEGLREPLRLFPKTSLHFVERELKPSKGSTPLESARKKWEPPADGWNPERGEPPESEDDYFHMAFRHVADPLDDKFQQLARKVFRPPLDARLETE